MSCNCNKNLITGTAALNGGSTEVDVTITAITLPTVPTRYTLKITNGMPVSGYGLPVKIVNGSGSGISLLTTPLAELVYGYQLNSPRCTDESGALYVTLMYVPSNSHFSVMRRLPNQ